MVPMSEQKRVKILDQVLALIGKNLPTEQASQVVAFTSQYYAHTPAEYLLEREVSDLYGAALAHWHFLQRRPPGAIIHRVYNPNIEESGWQATHTVIELVTDDRPFLVDSIRMELNRHGLTVHLIIHPIVQVERDTNGCLKWIFEPGETKNTAITEAILHVEVDRQTDSKVLSELANDVKRIVVDVGTVVNDWLKMRSYLHDALNEIEEQPPPLDPEEISEGKAFLQWLDDNHFTYLGCRDYELVMENGMDVLRIVSGSGLGILREKPGDRISEKFSILPPEIRKLAHLKELLIITKSITRATVHRPVNMDYIGVKRFDHEGNVIGEHRLLGLFTSAAYNRNPQDIPLLRRKVKNVMARSGLPLHGHSGKALLNILETFPRDDFIQASDDELFTIARGILQLEQRQRTRLFIRLDRYQRFLSCIVFVPRERYTTELRQRMQEILVQAFDGSSAEFTVRLSESMLARIEFLLHTPVGKLPDFDIADIEAQLLDATQSWMDHLQISLVTELGEEAGTGCFQGYSSAFPAGYREDFDTRTAVLDVLRMEALDPEDGLQMYLYHPLEAPPDWLRFKLFQRGHPIPLSNVLPVLENMGLKVIDERPYRITPQSGGEIWIHDFGMENQSKGEAFDTAHVRETFQDAFARVWRAEVENDSFNRLVLRAGLDWRKITIIRAYCKYLHQTGIAFSQSYIEQSLADHPAIACQLVELFQARFDPECRENSASSVTSLLASLQEALDAVPSLDADRILRSFLSLIQATVRTNYYQVLNGEHKPWLSFKFDVALIPELPQPRPLYEIFVYSPRMEGVHLRGGMVARGGVRWSDRPEDFRTEVLGLMKAQMVKNAMIVPVGAKGGFVVKRQPATSEKGPVKNEVTDAYHAFICGLLDLTDNLSGGGAQHPSDLVCYDDDDPYLVVAADKGTARFSDVANGIARDYRFWLGDAFASGGTAGYDHKAMGITARGAWESIKQHFRELGIDIASSPFSVIGIGDMSGDVFGNGMLLSRKIRLLGAFDHRHIFIDPDPDPETSYQERERLFRLSHSSWNDYDQKLISTGGGVFSRAAKRITLSPEARQALGTRDGSVTPNELIRRLLRAPVDLMWNGGIGTYVKAGYETHVEVGDRDNDGVRVNASELRCRVVGEGGNLGFTQRARIEYARQRGRIDTDFIHNSGGVNCSDHEVNIKILLDKVVADGDLTEKQRNQLLADMTGEVTELVLLDNYWHTQAISLDESQGSKLLNDQIRFMRSLERTGRLNRALEYLPDEETLAERYASGEGLSRPEIAVLNAYARNLVYDELLASDLPEDPWLSLELERYFPIPLRKRFGVQMPQHRLRREIIASFVTNRMINRLGTNFTFDLQEETGASAADIVKVYVIAWEVFKLRHLWTHVAVLDNQVPASLQTRMLLAGGKLVRRASLWCLRHCTRPFDVAAIVDRFAPGADRLAEQLPEILDPVDSDRLHDTARPYVEGGIPEDISLRVAALEPLSLALDIIDVANSSGEILDSVAIIYFSLGSQLELHWLREQVQALPMETHWQARASAALEDDLLAHQKALVSEALRLTSSEVPAETRLINWLEQNRNAVDRCRNVFSELKTYASLEFAMLSVALREVDNLVHLSASLDPLRDAEV